MQKKVVFAALGALALMSAAGASAADVKLYGVIDTGLSYTHVKGSGTDKLEMSSGNYAGPRWGLKGSEKLSDDVSVNFILESGFKSDTGELGRAGSIFNRESQLSITSPMGTLGFGRVGAFTSGSSSLSWYWDMEPFETGYTDAGIQATQVNVWRLNSNTIYYVSPEISGLKAGVQYSFTGAGSDQEAQEFSDNWNFANAAIRWSGSNARAILGVEWERAGTKDAQALEKQDDMWNFKLAAAYQPEGGPLTMYAGASLYRNYARFSDSTWDDDGKVAFAPDGRERLNGWSGFLGVKYTVGSADLLAMVQYLDGENKNPVEGGTADTDYSRTVGSIGCHYHLSGRTMLYAIAAYADGSGLLEEVENPQTERVTAHVGMTHFF